MYSALVDWEWTYTTCAGETWTDNETTEAGPYSLANDITGKPCPAAAPLPQTGSSVTGIVAAGGAAVLLGAMLVAFAMRRRRVRPQS
jgi:LPXTG-motif cell wall-anchored protein